MWDVFLLDYKYGIIKVVTEHGIITNNLPHYVLKEFTVDRIIGDNSLIEKEGYNDMIFLGTMYKKENTFRFTRHYTSFYCKDGKSAQQMFDESHDTIVKLLDREEKQKTLDRIKKYGITEKEYDLLKLYQSNAYYILNTLLHEVSLVKLMRRSPLGDFLASISYMKDPRNAAEFYCNIYSAMCKFRNIYKGNVGALRSCSKLYKKEMEQKNETISLLSFSPNGHNTIYIYEEQRINPIKLHANIEENVPFFDYSIIDNEQWSPKEENLSEILIPPFMQISYQDTNLPGEYYVNISYNSEEFTQNDEMEMKRLESIVFNTNVIERYYNECYYEFIHGLATEECSDKKLEQEFRNWQRQFKRYLKLRFKKISQEILKQKNVSSLETRLSFFKRMKNAVTEVGKNHNYSANNQKRN